MSGWIQATMQQNTIIKYRYIALSRKLEYEAKFKKTI